MPIRSIEAQKIYDEIWKDRAAIGTVLFTLVIDSYGQEIFDMDPQAFREELEEGFRVSDIPAVNTDKVWVLWNALTTDLVHTDPSTFINAANVLNGTALSYDVFDLADIYECAWAITELTMLDAETANRLSPEVKRYIGEVCKEQGLYRPPSVLLKAADFGNQNYAANIESHAVDGTELQVMLKAQQEFSDDVKRYVDRQTSRMMLQLNSIPLINKDTKSWNTFVTNFGKVLQ
jgi:hypothetical protein